MFLKNINQKKLTPQTFGFGVLYFV